LLDYIKSTFGNSKACLYVNLNHFYFSANSLVEFASDFRKTGGQTLVLDQVYKYTDWSAALSEINYKFPDLQVIFTGSPVMRLKADNPYLAGKVASYHLRGLSFREFLNYESGNNFSKYALDNMLKYHSEIAKDILIKVKPLAYFDDYLRHGFYPFYVDSHNFNEEMIKTVNLTLEIDIPYLQQMEPAYLPKLRKLILLISDNMPHNPISQIILSNGISYIEGNVMNYLKYLKNCTRLINLVYDGGCAWMSKKPVGLISQIYHFVTFLISLNSPGVLMR
jgi:predicted AAA+ superfamily ATPase